MVLLSAVGGFVSKVACFLCGNWKKYIKNFIFFIKLHGKPQVSEFFGIFVFTSSDTFSDSDYYYVVHKLVFTPDSFPFSVVEIQHILVSLSCVIIVAEERLPP